MAELRKVVEAINEKDREKHKELLETFGMKISQDGSLIAFKFAKQERNQPYQYP